MQKFCVIFLMIIFTSSFGFCEPIAVIVNKSNSVNNIKLKTLMGIYKGEERFWKDGTAIIAVNRPVDDLMRETFYKVILKSQSSKTFFRKGSPIPISYVMHKSSRSVKRFVSRMKGSIGFIELKEVDDSIKILSINSISPTEDNIKSGKYILQSFNN